MDGIFSGGNIFSAPTEWRMCLCVRIIFTELYYYTSFAEVLHVSNVNILMQYIHLDKTVYSNNAIQTALKNEI